MRADRDRALAHRAQVIKGQADCRDRICLPAEAREHSHRHIHHRRHHPAVERSLGIAHPAAHMERQLQCLLLRTAGDQGRCEHVVDAVLTAGCVRSAETVTAADLSEHARHIVLLRLVFQSGKRAGLHPFKCSVIHNRLLLPFPQRCQADGHGDCRADHGVVAHADEAHHFHMRRDRG